MGQLKPKYSILVLNCPNCAHSHLYALNVFSITFLAGWATLFCPSFLSAITRIWPNSAVKGTRRPVAVLKVFFSSGFGGFGQAQ